MVLIVLFVVRSALLRNPQESIEYIRGNPLDTCVYDALLIQPPAPGDRSCAEDPGVAQCLIDG